MARPTVYPFGEVGSHSGERYPDWIRALDGKNGIYVIRERETGALAYVGESHSGRLYGTLTRHFQRWSEKYNTAGPTYDRADTEVAVVLVPKTHALHLQNDLICALDPRDNRLTCDEIFDHETEPPEPPPHSYHYDIAAIIDALFYTDEDSDVPF